MASKFFKFNRSSSQTVTLNHENIDDNHQYEQQKQQRVSLAGSGAPLKKLKDFIRNKFSLNNTSNDLKSSTEKLNKNDQSQSRDALDTLKVQDRSVNFNQNEYASREQARNLAKNLKDLLARSKLSQNSENILVDNATHLSEDEGFAKTPDSLNSSMNENISKANCNYSCESFVSIGSIDSQEIDDKYANTDFTKFKAVLVDNSMSKSKIRAAQNRRPRTSFDKRMDPIEETASNLHNNLNSEIINNENNRDGSNLFNEISVNLNETEKTKSKSNESLDDSIKANKTIDQKAKKYDQSVNSNIRFSKNRGLSVDSDQPIQLISKKVYDHNFNMNENEINNSITTEQSTFDKQNENSTKIEPIYDNFVSNNEINSLKLTSNSKEQVNHIVTDSLNEFEVTLRKTPSQCSPKEQKSPIKCYRYSHSQIDQEWSPVTKLTHSKSMKLHNSSDNAQNEIENKRTTVHPLIKNTQENTQPKSLLKSQQNVNGDKILSTQQSDKDTSPQLKRPTSTLNDTTNVTNEPEWRQVALRKQSAWMLNNCDSTVDKCEGTSNDTVITKSLDCDRNSRVGKVKSMIKDLEK